MRRGAWQAISSPLVVGLAVLVLVLVASCCCPLLGRKGPAALEGWIAFHGSRRSREKLNIYVMRADGSGVTRLTEDKEDSIDASWSPDGSRIAFTRVEWLGADIYVMNADGSEQMRLTDSPGYDEDPAWSPDGQRIAFASDRDGDFEIYVMNADGSGQTRLTDSPGRSKQPTWSPDGKRIAFEEDRAGDYGIYVVDVDGGEWTRLAEGGDPAWSPDGKHVAFENYAPEDRDVQIYVIGIDGTGLRRVTEYRPWQGGCSDPAWSPDGAWIVFGTNHWGLAVVRPDGSGYTRLTRRETHTPWWLDGAPSWVAARQ